MSSHSDWGHIYQQNIPNQSPPSGRTYSETTFAEATTMTTTTPTTTMATAISPTHMSSTCHLNPDGRVSKPIRRRSRASRRTPTTLLNTDTSNFRAMVQQFTGGPSASFTMDHHLSNNTLLNNNPGSRFTGFGFNHRQQVAQASPNVHPQVMVPNLQYHQQYNDVVVQPHQSMTTQMSTPPQHQFMFSLRNPNMNSPGNPSMELPGGGGFGAVDGEGGGSQVPSRARQGPASSSGENRRSNSGGGFLF